MSKCMYKLRDFRLAIFFGLHLADITGKLIVVLVVVLTLGKLQTNSCNVFSDAAVIEIKLAN